MVLSLDVLHAAITNDLDRIRAYFATGADPDEVCRTGEGTDDERTHTLLHAAVRGMHVDCVRLVVGPTALGRPAAATAGAPPA